MTRWITASMLELPKVPWVLSYQDRKFLEGIKIDSEEPPLSAEA